MGDFIPGQRWINHAELQLGLGTVLSTEGRTVTLVFLASGETRTYATGSAPLTRVRFVPGDTVRDHQGLTLTVERVEEQAGLLTYHGRARDGTLRALPEGELDSQLQLNRPGERLLTGQVDPDPLFRLRYQTLQHRERLAQSTLYGLSGGRTSLIPHQLYIAHEVARRHAPRVLLADEVGLGKTIEAGMIIHQQLLSERARRVLIVVPESLLHQWLVEMLRRFNLTFSVLDEARCEAILDSGAADNPFHAEQQVLCTLEFLLEQPARAQQAIDGEWDLLVVDEAHHLHWSPGDASPGYRLVEQLAGMTRCVLLLTATPEQLGKASHFARLRLLDANRFHDLDAFIREEQDYEPVAAAVDALFEARALDDSALATLRTRLADADSQALLEAAREPDAPAARTQLVEQLLDRHGTGRVLFRNTRSAIRGFPRRTLQAWPLPLPDAYTACLAAAANEATTGIHGLLSPELLYRDTADEAAARWTSFDPRVQWLCDQLRAMRPHKVLVITADAGTAMDLAEWLHRSKGLHAAVFHEGMSLVERDRAAAYFADLEFGTQVLICSEIGSEGRNFQFAHQLVLFDLPLNPDLLEQRIGRLDRIGQQHDIRIHVPCLAGSAQQLLLDWYHEGLNAFEQICPPAVTIFEEQREALLATLQQQGDITALVQAARERRTELEAALQRGRDRLLEFNSCRPDIAQQLQAQAEAVDADPRLHDYLEQLADSFGLELEPHSAGSHILRPGEHTHGHFPGLRDEGITFTCDRSIALANEDREFISWEHPLITAAMDMIASAEFGNTAMTRMPYPGAAPGTLLLEALYTLDAAASELLQTRRYLPVASTRILVDQYGRDHGQALSHEQINERCEPIAADTVLKIVHGYAAQLRELLAHADQLASQQARVRIEATRAQSLRTLSGEIARLRALAHVNPSVREDELAFLQLQYEALEAALAHASFRLDALRVVVAT